MNQEQKQKGRSPAFQFYADDFLAGTITMTNEEKGAYISLLCIQWSRGFLSENDFQRVCAGMPTHSHGICQGKFEVDSEGHYRNKRLEVERAKQREYSEKQREIANRRWKTDAKAMPTHMPTHMPDDAKAMPTHMPESCSPSPSPSPKEEYRAPKSPRQRFEKPSLEAVQARCTEIGLPLNEASKFINYYESKGWMVGKNHMKCWKASLAGWKSRREENLAGLLPIPAARKEIDWRDSL